MEQGRDGRWEKPLVRASHDASRQPYNGPFSVSRPERQWEHS